MSSQSVCILFDAQFEFGFAVGFGFAGVGVQRSILTIANYCQVPDEGDGAGGSGAVRRGAPEVEPS